MTHQLIYIKYQLNNLKFLLNIILMINNWYFNINKFCQLNCVKCQILSIRWSNQKFPNYGL